MIPSFVYVKLVVFRSTIILRGSDFFMYLIIVFLHYCNTMYQICLLLMQFCKIVSKIKLYQTQKLVKLFKNIVSAGMIL